MDEGASGLANETTRLASSVRSVWSAPAERSGDGALHKVSLGARSSRGRRAREREDETLIVPHRVPC